eukprot:SAG11_NODE_10005_length_863_cov_0.849476_2_plen_47_part_01
MLGLRIELSSVVREQHFVVAQLDLTDQRTRHRQMKKDDGAINAKLRM